MFLQNYLAIQRLTLLALEMEYSMKTGWIPFLLMPCPLESPSHQQQLYIEYAVHILLPSGKISITCAPHQCRKIIENIISIFMFTKMNSALKGLKSIDFLS